MATIKGSFNQKKSCPRVTSQRAAWLLAGLLAALPFAGPARADLVLSFSDPGNVGAGSTGDSFDVMLTNTGSADVSLAVFTFEVATTSSDITFTDVTTATADLYIFAGNSLIGPDILGATTGQDLTAFDLYSGVGDATVAAGATVGLGHVLFDVAAIASSGTADLELVGTGTSLATSSIEPVPIQTLSPGLVQTTGSGSSLPEPPELLVFLTAAAVGCRGVRGGVRRV